QEAWFAAPVRLVEIGVEHGDLAGVAGSGIQEGGRIAERREDLRFESFLGHACGEAAAKADWAHRGGIGVAQNSQRAFARVELADEQVLTQRAVRGRYEFDRRLKAGAKRGGELVEVRG